MVDFIDEYNSKNDREYTNGEITVFWKPKKCIHATTCYRELIEVFNPRKRPWVDMKGASTNEIIRVVNLCPTDALTYKYNKDVDKTDGAASADTENEVRIMKDGPVVLKGNFKLISTDETELKRMKITSLCRCGASMQLPYCDGMHRKTGFADK